MGEGKRGRGCWGEAQLTWFSQMARQCGAPAVDCLAQRIGARTAATYKDINNQPPERSVEVLGHPKDLDFKFFLGSATHQVLLFWKRYFYTSFFT